MTPSKSGAFKSEYSLLGYSRSVSSRYKFGTDFERDLKREVFKIVHRGKEFATMGFLFRAVSYLALFFFLQYRWITLGSSLSLAIIYGIVLNFETCLCMP